MDYKSIYSEYLRNGCVKIEDFFTLGEVEELQKGVSEVVERVDAEENHVFSEYGVNQKQKSDEYFINSSDKIRYFFENDAFDEEGNLLFGRKEALSRVGYALHWWHPIFKKYTFNQKIKDLLRHFQYKDPVVVQSILIFKKPKIGEIVRSHQDSTFLYTDPPTCLGIWLPLEDATEENGCLWFVPGSHTDGIHRRFIRNPDKSPMFLMKGDLPDYEEKNYIALPARKGDCVVIHGAVVHKSGRNTTETARPVYTYHVVESDATWSQGNWAQPSENLPFPSVYSN